MRTIGFNTAYKVEIQKDDDYLMATINDEPPAEMEGGCLVDEEECLDN